MCSLCGGSICGSSGGCISIINQSPEIIKIAYSNGNNVISTFTSYFTTVFSTIKNSLFSLIENLRRGS